MNALNSYPDKENKRAGMPVIKDSDIDRVKRNLLMPVPLKARNQLDNNNTSKTPSVFLSERKCVNSPITELAYNLAEMAAHETSQLSCSNTPKRRLSLASSSGNSTPDINIHLQSFSSSSKSGENSEESISSENGSLTKPVNVPMRKSLEPRSGAFRRYNSMPFSSAHVSNEASPLLISAVPKNNLTCSLSHSTVQPMVTFHLGNDETSHDSQDSGFGREERFNFVAPTIPPERAQLANEQSPVEVGNRGYVLGSPDLCDTTAIDSSDSPLLAHRLCSQSEEEENDDGFIDLDDLESQCASDVPDAIANMLTGKMITSSTSHVTKKEVPAPITHFKGHLFRSPSMPQHLGGGNSYDIKRRVLIGNKRPDPPYDNNTPLAAVKKRRGPLSDGNMIPSVPRKFDAAVTNSANRLQRCRSMVEHSVTFQLNNNKVSTDRMTGDFERKCCLPLINGKNQDLNTISHDTMAQILQNEFDSVLSSCTIVDCRYPYEYLGGHIKGAKNIYTKEDLYTKYLTHQSLNTNKQDDKRDILIFHCEFSSERAPKLSRFLRNHDREINEDHYPSLYHPEVYLLEGGYKVFFEQHQELCEPTSYKTMLDKDHSDELKTFRAKSKSWAGAEKRGGFRPGLSKRL